MKRLALFLLTISSFLFASAAQDVSEQVLVFRNTGEINLFYADQLDSIVRTKYDADSILHEDYVSLVYYAVDTTMVIPLAEIDSVAFGSRNEMKFYDGVRIIDEDDFDFISRCEGNTIYYKTSTPSDLLPKLGEKIYSEGCEDLMPNGVAAKVEGVNNQGTEIAVVLSPVDIQEIFEKLFYAGDINGIPETVRNFIQKGAPSKLKLEVGLDADNIGRVSTSGTLTFDGNAIVDVFRHYYKVDASLDFDIDVDIELNAKENASVHKEPTMLSVDLPTIYGVIKPTITLGGFLDMNADLSFKYNLNRHFTRHVIWERKDGENTWTFPEDKNNGTGETTAKTELTLNGSLYMGPEVALDFHVIGDFVGARAKVKVGPEISGSVTMGMLQDLQTYEPQAYGNADLDFKWRLKAETSLLNKEGWIWGEEKETKLGTFGHQWGEHKLHLFPEFKQTKAVKKKSETTPSAQAVGAVTKTETDLEHSLEVGFQVVDNNGNVIDSVFVDSLDAHCAGLKGIKSEIDMKDVADTQELQLRPVFHYAGYTIPYASVRVKDDIQIQPMVFGMTRQGTRILSGYPFTGSVIAGSTLYTAGPFQQMYKPDTLFVGKDERQYNATVLSGIYDIVGTWKGSGNGKDYTLIFNEDESVIYNGIEGKYKANYPQMGEITLILNDDSTIVFSVKSINNTTLVLIDKKQKITITLNKQ
ncbi:MAG: hypothetical protein Q4F34_05085 [Prevotellaceae bacterium]|nr:hypothetical protein [Prevotellaceae bacterium]